MASLSPSSPTETRPACLLIDGQHMHQAREAAGHPPFHHVVRALEIAYGCRFVRKEWHEATPDGRPSPFHLAISTPEAGHIIPKVRALQTTSGFAVTSEERTTSHRVAIRVPKGVDVALALAMVQHGHHNKRFEEYGLVVVVTGDGDLEEAFERTPMRVVVCGSRNELAPTLRPWVRSEGNRGLYLDEVMVVAQSLAAGEPGGGSGKGGVTQQQLYHQHQHQHQHQQQQRLAAHRDLGVGGMHTNDAQSTSRTANRNDMRPGNTVVNLGMGTLSSAATVTKSSGSNNKKMVDSPVSFPSAYGAIPTSGDLQAERWKHQVLQQQQQQQQQPEEEKSLTGPSYLPPHLAGCDSSAITGSLGGSNGSDSGNGSETHGRQRRRKSSKLRLRCFAGPLCTKLKDEDHLRKTTHPCPMELACPVLHAVETPETILHMERFLHPCPRGRACLDESFEHSSLFEHVGRNVLPLCTIAGCKGGMSGGGISGGGGGGEEGKGRMCGSQKDRQMTKAAVEQYHGGVPHMHICPHGRQCSFLSHSVADKRVIRHTASFIHPCPWGARCVARRAETWNWQHMLQFTHFAEDDEQVQREREEEEGKGRLVGREGREGINAERDKGRMDEYGFFSLSSNTSNGGNSSSNSDGQHVLNHMSSLLHQLPSSDMTTAHASIVTRLQAHVYAHALASAQHSPSSIPEERRDVNAGLLLSSSSSSFSFSSEGGDHSLLGTATVAAGKGEGEGGRKYLHHEHHHTASSLGRGGADNCGEEEEEAGQEEKGAGERGGVDDSGGGKEQFLIPSFSSSLLSPAYQNIW